MAVNRPANAALPGDCRHVDVGGYRLHGCVAGSRGPVVVLDAGAGYGMETWEPLLAELSEIALVVTFDRAGIGRSDPGPAPRTPQRIAGEIHRLLSGLGLRPDVLVGHSAGGLHVLQYAASYPAGVDAVVLLDTPGPGFRARWRATLSTRERARLDRLEAERSSTFPEGVRKDLLGAREHQDLELTGFPRHLRLVAVVADTHGWTAPAGGDGVEELWQRLQRERLTLSDAAELVVARDTGHMVHHDRPELVLGVLRQVVASLAEPPAADRRLREPARRPG